LDFDWLIRRQGVEKGDIRANLYVSPDSENDPRDIALKAPILVCLEVTDEIKLHISLLLRHDISRRNIEES
jgi:hypothetical protein